VSKRFFTPLDLTGTVNESIVVPERSIRWSNAEGTLEVGLKGGNVKLAVGQEELALCYNGTGNTLAKGTVVYISGAQGQRPSISKASASSESTSSKTFGIVAEEISNGAEGLVCTYGIVRGVDTSTFTEGQALWLSTTAGLISSTIPTQPNHSVFIGYCIKSNATSGQIFVKIQNGYELQELHNVLITSPSTGQTLKYNSTTGLWENGSIDGGVFEVFYQASTPSSPQLGDIWVESDVDVTEYDAIDLSPYATLSSPIFTGIPIAPTASSGTNTTQIATTAFVQQAASTAESAALTVISNHESDTTNIHGISDTANLVYNNDSRLSDSRTPTLHASSHGVSGSDSITIAQSQVTGLDTALGGKEPTISAGTTSQYWRGDKSWQTLDKSTIGLSNVEDTALSTWAGSSNITNLGTISSGTWQGSVIGSSYIDTSIARLASPSFTGTANAERISVDSTAYIDTITTTVSSTSSTEIDSFVQSSFSSCEYLIQIKQGSKITVLKALMTSVDLDIVQYGIVESGGSIPYTITTDSFIPSGGPVTTKLLITITDANTTSATVKVVRTSVV